MEYADGTRLDIGRMPLGEIVGGHALCPDGKVRRLARVAPHGDTFFSVPASVRVRGKYVAGYVTVQTRDGFSTATDSAPAVVKFFPYLYRKNHAMVARIDSHGEGAL